MWKHDRLDIRNGCYCFIHTELGGRGEQATHQLVIVHAGGQHFVGDLAWRKDGLRRRGERLAAHLLQGLAVSEAAVAIKQELIERTEVRHGN
jgi:hypothetical protein